MYASPSDNLMQEPNWHTSTIVVQEKTELNLSFHVDAGKMGSIPRRPIDRFFSLFVEDIKLEAHWCAAGHFHPFEFLQERTGENKEHHEVSSMVFRQSTNDAHFVRAQRTSKWLK